MVTKDVPAYALVVGNPARQTGWMSAFDTGSTSTPRAAACPNRARHACAMAQSTLLQDTMSTKDLHQRLLDKTTLAVIGWAMSACPLP